MNLLFAVILSTILISSYVAGTARARVVAGRSMRRRLPSLPKYYGLYTLLWSLLPPILIAAVWGLSEPLALRTIVVSQAKQEITAGRVETDHDLKVLFTEVKNIADGALSAKNATPGLVALSEYYTQTKSSSQRWFYGCSIVLCLGGFLYAIRSIRDDFSARAGVERIFHAGLVFCSSIAILTTVGIVSSLIFESMRFFNKVSLTEFLFGLHWSPQIAMRADQVGSSGAFGSLPLIAGTVLIAFIAMCVATPLGLFSAIYLAEYATKRTRAFVKPLLEILAGIPTVVYGFFAALTVSPALRSLGVDLGLDVSSESALAAGLVMGVMIIPFISSLSDDVINAVPQTLRDGSLALGATKSETIKKVVIPAALPGIMGAVLLAISRAIGETMIVVMAAGLAAQLTLNPLESVTTVTVQIVTILVGDQEFDSAKTLAAFALGLLLFSLTLVLNVIALQIVKKYREKYD